MRTVSPRSGRPFHFDDEPVDVVHADLYGGLDPSIPVPEWKSLTIPTCAITLVAPGVVALDAASITVPVMSATGERDVVPDPSMEPKAFKSSNDVTVYVCDRMAHMHNFAGTRVRFWQRLHSWGTGVVRWHHRDVIDVVGGQAKVAVGLVVRVRTASSSSMPSPGRSGRVIQPPPSTLIVSASM